VTALDTSICIPALLTWHEHHQASRAAAQGARIPAHALLETYSVLTRLPAPHRLSGDRAAALLDARFAASDVLASPTSVQRSIVSTLASKEVEGGSAYDAYIAMTAAAHDEVLLTRDHRAARTYEALQAPFELVD